MLKWAVIMFVAAIVCAALGFSGIAASFSWVAQALAALFAALFIASLVFDGVGSATSSSGV